MSTCVIYVAESSSLRKSIKERGTGRLAQKGKGAIRKSNFTPVGCKEMNGFQNDN